MINFTSDYAAEYLRLDKAKQLENKSSPEEKAEQFQTYFIKKIYLSKLFENGFFKVKLDDDDKEEDDLMLSLDNPVVDEMIQDKFAEEIASQDVFGLRKAILQQIKSSKKSKNNPIANLPDLIHENYVKEQLLNNNIVGIDDRKLKIKSLSESS